MEETATSSCTTTSMGTAKDRLSTSGEEWTTNKVLVVIFILNGCLSVGQMLSVHVTSNHIQQDHNSITYTIIGICCTNWMTSVVASRVVFFVCMQAGWGFQPRWERSFLHLGHSAGWGTGWRSSAGDWLLTVFMDLHLHLEAWFKTWLGFLMSWISTWVQVSASIFFLFDQFTQFLSHKLT